MVKIMKNPECVVTNRNKLKHRSFTLSWFFIFVFVISAPLSTRAQQPQAQLGQPIYPVNAKYANGVAPGYWPTKGNGLNLNLSAGTAGLCGNVSQAQRVVANYTGGTLQMAANATNYVYLSPVGPHPAAAPTLTTSSSGGSLVAGTYKVYVTYTNPSGETVPNDINGESSIVTTGSSSTITITSPPASMNATGWNVYVSTVNGDSWNETKQNASPIALGSNYSVSSLISGPLNPFTDTSGCAPWSGTSGFGPGQQPIAIVTTDGSAITNVVDARNWFNSGVVADTGGQVFNVMAYGAQGDGVADDTAAIQATIVAANDWSGGIVYFPPGIYNITSTLTTGIGALVFSGAGIQTVLQPEFSGDVIAVNDSRFRLEDLLVNVNYPSASRGNSAVIAANANGGSVSNVVVLGTTQNNGIFFRSDVAGGTNDDWTFESLSFPGQVTLWQDVFLLQYSSSTQTLASYFFTNVGGWVKVVDAAVDINGTVDTVWFIQSGFTVASGSTGPSLWIKNTVSSQTEFPRWIECVHCGIEATDQTAIEVDAGKNIEYSGYIAGATTGIAVGSVAVETSIHDTIFVYIKQSAITYAGTGGLHVADCQFDSSGQQTNNTYDTISIANGAQNIQIANNSWRNSTFFSPNLPRYGINVGTGVSNYSITGNQYSGATFGTAFSTDGSHLGNDYNSGNFYTIGKNDSSDKAIQMAYSSVPTWITSSFDGSNAYTALSNNFRPAGNSFTAPGNSSYGNLLLSLKSSTGSSSKFAFAYAPPTSGTPSPSDLVTILSSGNLGIGRTSPAQKLDVNGSMVAAVNAVTFSATPTFDASLGNTQTITLTGNVTSSTLSNATAGEQINFIICQDGTGGRTFVWPSNIKGGMTIGATASKCSAQIFAYDGTNAYAVSGGETNM
jgi:Pectate lyase superfamily protein